MRVATSHVSITNRKTLPHERNHVVVSTRYNMVLNCWKHTYHCHHNIATFLAFSKSDGSSTGPQSSPQLYPSPPNLLCSIATKPERDSYLKHVWFPNYIQTVMTFLFIRIFRNNTWPCIWFVAPGQTSSISTHRKRPRGSKWTRILQNCSETTVKKISTTFLTDWYLCRMNCNKMFIVTKGMFARLQVMV